MQRFTGTDDRLSPTGVVHPARRISYDELIAGLDAARAAGMVYRRFEPSTGLALYVYASKCVFDDGWDRFSTLARGLIVDPDAKRIVATPFPKFFNLGEKHGEVPDRRSRLSRKSTDR